MAVIIATQGELTFEDQYRSYLKFWIVYFELRTGWEQVFNMILLKSLEILLLYVDR